MGTPYSGNPNNYPTAVTIPSGSDTPSSAVFDTAFEGEIDRSAWIAAHGSIGDLVTLQPPFTWPVGSTDGPHAMCWNDTSLATDSTVGQRWLAAVVDSGFAHLQVYAGFADGSTGTWTQVGNNITYSSTASDLCTDAGGNIYVSFLSGASSLFVYQRSPGASSWTSFIVVSGLTSPTDLKMAALASGALFYAVGSASATHAQISGAFGGGFPSLTASNWLVRSNGSMVLFVPAAATASPTVYKATGTSTYSSASIGLATTDVPQDLAWSPVWNKWILVVRTSGNASTIWTSPDGATWTLVQTLSHLPQPIVSMVAVGPYVVGLMGNATAGTPAQLCSSADFGVTWYPHAMGTIIAISTFAKLVASPSQLLSVAMGSLNAAIVANIRASSILGGGTQVLT